MRMAWRASSCFGVDLELAVGVRADGLPKVRLEFALRLDNGQKLDGREALLRGRDLVEVGLQ